MKVKLIDTETDKTCIVDERSEEDGSPLFDAYWWSEGNGSCDCNRSIYCGVDDLDDPDYGICRGGKRFLIIEADTDEYTLAELNNEYPEELLKKYGILA